MKKPTIRDVAELAGVSIATVSRVFSGKRSHIPISPRTVQKVEEAASRLRYMPNSVARSLVRHKTNIIGLVVPDIIYSYFPQITRGVEAIAYSEGHQVILCDSEEDPRKEARHLRTLLERQCEGIIVAPVSPETRDTLDSLSGQGVPVVLVDRHFGEEFDFVGTDGYEGARSVALHLSDLGHRRLGHLRGSPFLSSAEEYLAGFRDGLRSVGIDLLDDLVRGDGYYEQDGFRGMEELLSLHSPPTAVFAANDIIALGALRALEAHGFRVPEDMALVGSGNLTFAGLLKVPLSTLDERPEEIGREAVRLLCARLAGDGSPPDLMRIRPTLVVRASSGTARRAEHRDTSPPP